jgi:carboxylate-amine ligase
LLASEVLLDAGMLYFAARLSRNHPTVEVRVADVPLDVGATTTVAALIRALVDTAAAEWRQGVEPLHVSTTELRLAGWQAALGGVRGLLIDPTSGCPAPAEVVLDRLLGLVAPALTANGDDGLVAAGVSAILEGGTGADLQRRALRGFRGLDAVVLAAIERTHRVPSTPAGSPHRLVA